MCEIANPSGVSSTLCINPFIHGEVGKRQQVCCISFDVFREIYFFLRYYRLETFIVFIVCLQFVVIYNFFQKICEDYVRVLVFTTFLSKQVNFAKNTRYIVDKVIFQNVLIQQINSFHAAGLLLYPLKLSVNFQFSDVFKGYRETPVA